MRTIKEIEADIQQNDESYAAYQQVRKVRLDNMVKALDEELSSWRDEVVQKSFKLITEREEAMIAAAAHPLEGRKFRKVEKQYSGRRYCREIIHYGIIIVVRSVADLPPVPKNSRYYKGPEMGSAYLRRTDAKGNLLTKWVSLMPNGSSPFAWTLVEEEA